MKDSFKKHPFLLFCYAIATLTLYYCLHLKVVIDTAWLDAYQQWLHLIAMCLGMPHLQAQFYQHHDGHKQLMLLTIDTIILLGLYLAPLSRNVVLLILCTSLLKPVLNGMILSNRDDKKKQMILFYVVFIICIICHLLFTLFYAHPLDVNASFLFAFSCTVLLANEINLYQRFHRKKVESYR